VAWVTIADALTKYQVSHVDFMAPPSYSSDQL
jgi:hypothetical protein